MYGYYQFWKSFEAMTKCGIICEQISGLNDRLMRQTYPSERYLGILSRLYCIRCIVLEPCLNDKHVTSDVFEIRQQSDKWTILAYFQLALTFTKEYVRGPIWVNWKADAAQYFVCVVYSRCVCFADAFFFVWIIACIPTKKWSTLFVAIWMTLKGINKKH